MASPATAAAGATFLPGGLFSADALEANRGGRLTDVQRRQLGRVERAWRKNELVGAAVLVVIGALLLTETAPAPNDWARPFVGIGAIVVAIALVVHAMPGADRLSRDLGRAGVVSLDGAIGKHVVQGDRTAMSWYYLDVADQQFEVPGRSEYDAAPDAGYVRVYYLPQSHKVVNLERLPDPPLPAGAMSSPETLETIAREMKSGGVARREAMAELAQMGQLVKGIRVDAPAPPADGRDPRPLAEAIVGTWQAGPASLTFGSDGAVQVNLPFGRTHQGHWSVDGAGRLHSDAMGKDQAGEAWVAGDTLTLALDGEGISWQRVTSA